MIIAVLFHHELYIGPEIPESLRWYLQAVVDLQYLWQDYDCIDVHKEIGEGLWVLVPSDNFLKYSAVSICRSW